MKNGQLLLNDSGAENAMCYAGDITRTMPVNGKFSSRQREIYDIVLDMETLGIESIKPGVKNRDIHLSVNRLLIENFVSLGLLKGNIDDMVEQGVAGMFMPHGLGHMMGLDVHDMEDLGEKYVGYEPGQERATYLGLKSLRLAKTLQPGFVLTVEPGIYFIPQLIQKYRVESKFLDFVNYDKLESYLDFGGIRIEDNILVTDTSYQVLGEYIPKKVEEIEELMELQSNERGSVC
jgi:Xaa-Pro aminopeptidase